MMLLIGKESSENSSDQLYWPVDALKKINSPPLQLQCHKNSRNNIQCIVCRRKLSRFN